MSGLGLSAAMLTIPRHDFDDFQPVALGERAAAEFRGRDRLAVVLHHDAAREELIVNEKLLDGAGQRGGDFPSVGDDKSAGAFK